MAFRIKFLTESIGAAFICSFVQFHAEFGAPSVPLQFFCKLGPFSNQIPCETSLAQPTYSWEFRSLRRSRTSAQSTCTNHLLRRSDAFGLSSTNSHSFVNWSLCSHLDEDGTLAHLKWPDGRAQATRWYDRATDSRKIREAPWAIRYNSLFFHLFA